MTDLNRRETMVFGAAALFGAMALPVANAQERGFAPLPGPWRTFELTTKVDVLDAKGTTKLWAAAAVGRPGVPAEAWAINGPATPAALALSRIRTTAPKCCSRSSMPALPCRPLSVSSTVRTRSRAVDWDSPRAAREDAASLRSWTRPTELMPTDGIVLATAREAIGDARADEEMTRRIYEWVVSHTYREPKVRGCGVGDIRTMLETANFGGKCGDINGLFVGLCRSVGIPARDLYGIRLVPSAFGYRELGGNPAEAARGAALPRRGVPEALRLGCDGPGRCRQGHAPGVDGVDPRRPQPAGRAG